MVPEQTPQPASAEAPQTGKPAKPPVGANVEISAAIPRRAYERLGIECLRTGKSRGEILGELVLKHLPNWVIQLRQSTDDSGTPAEKPDGQATAAVENKKEMPTGKDVIAKIRARRTG